MCSPWAIYCHVFCISVLLLVTSLLRTAPKHGAAALSGVPKGKTAVLCGREGTRVSEKLGSGMSYRAADPDFNMDESTVYS